MAVTTQENLDAIVDTDGYMVARRYKDGAEEAEFVGGAEARFLLSELSEEELRTWEHVVEIVHTASGVAIWQA